MRTSGDSAVESIIGLCAVLAILAACRGCDSLECDELREMTGNQTDWRFISGCYVKVGNRWVHRDSWRGEQEREK